MASDDVSVGKDLEFHNVLRRMPAKVEHQQGAVRVFYGATTRLTALGDGVSVDGGVGCN